MSKQRYNNLDERIEKRSIKDFFNWKKETKNRLKKDFTIQIPQAEEKQTEFLRNNKEQFTITWVGHSTFLIQLDGMNILTDPVWAPRMGLESRLTPPGINIEDLPEIDVVVISHSHYDHLDFTTIKKLKGNPVFFVPEGLKRTFIRRGFKNTIELSWWEEKTLSNIQFTFVPAQHWTRRGIFDMNTSHWGGWIISSKVQGQNIYFVGDTGYFQGFKEIGRKFEIEYVLMPIGAYEPEWFMKPSHINPDDAVKAFIELKAKYFIPMHYGTYHLADDTGPEALDRLHKAWNNERLEREKLRILKLGETLKVTEKVIVS